MRDEVRDYYGKTLQSSADLKSNACCTATPPPPAIAAALADIHPDVSARYYGCGLVAPDAVEGRRILDLGCGTGRDVFLLARLAGETGEVVGVDMTDEQLAVAREHEAWHAERYGYAGPNTRFLKGYIEELDALGLELASFDVVVSNCVINLATDKLAVFRGAAGLLKPGGVMHFADVYADREIPAELRTDPVLYGECLSGALAWDEFLRIAREAGFLTPRLVEHRPLEVNEPKLAKKLGDIRFVSATVELRRAETDAACCGPSCCEGAAPDPFAQTAGAAACC